MSQEIYRVREDPSLKNHGELSKTFEEINLYLKTKSTLDPISIKCEKFVGYYILKVESLKQLDYADLVYISEKKNFSSLWFSDNILMIKFNDNVIEKVNNIPKVENLDEVSVEIPEFEYACFNHGNIKKAIERFKLSNNYKIISDIYCIISDYCLDTEKTKIEVLENTGSNVVVLFNYLDEDIPLIDICNDIKINYREYRSIGDITYIPLTKGLKITTTKPKKRIYSLISSDNDEENLPKKRK